MKPVIPQDEFLQRRKRVLQQLPANVVALVAANQELTRSNDTGTTGKMATFIYRV